jgi:hypothetical protein
VITDQIEMRQRDKLAAQEAKEQENLAMLSMMKGNNICIYMCVYVFIFIYTSIYAYTSVHITHLENLAMLSMMKG